VLLNAAILEWMLATAAIVTMAGLALAGGLPDADSRARGLTLALAIGVDGRCATRAEALGRGAGGTW
jgi:hypothetical protein